MHPLFRCELWATIVVVSVACVSWTFAAPPADQLLPENTEAFVSIVDVPRLVERWHQTQLGQLLDDPAMEPFANDLQKQLEDSAVFAKRDFGLTWDDLKGVAAGELAIALVHLPEKRPAVAALIDTTGNGEKVNALLAKIGESLTAEGAKLSERAIGGQKVFVYDLKIEVEGDPQRRVAYCIKEELLIAASEVAAIADILSRWDGDGSKTIAGHKPYVAVMDRCRSHAGETKPDIRWFFDPFGYIDATRILAEEANATGEGQEMIDALRSSGFEAVKAAGGYVNLLDGPYELLHRTAIHAPPPHTKSMQMLTFPNGRDLAAQDWVPSDLAYYVTFHCDVQKAFANFGPLFDGLFGEGEEGVWIDVLDSLKEDPNGPRIDLDKDLIAHLGSRITVLVDYSQPITPTSERLLFAIETTNEKALADTIRRSMETDPTVKKRTFKEYVIWEIDEEEPPEDDPRLKPITIDGVPGPQSEDEPVMEERLMPRSAVTVANGHMYVASHIELLRKVLTEIPRRRALSNTADYQRVMNELDSLGGEGASFRIFVRTDEAYRATYELLRQGRLPEAETISGSLLNRVFSSGEKDMIREQKLDTTNMPEFQVVRRYLGSGGMYIVTEDDGWFAVGFSLRKDAPVATDADAGDAADAEDDPDEAEEQAADAGGNADATEQAAVPIAE